MTRVMIGTSIALARLEFGLLTVYGGYKIAGRYEEDVLYPIVHSHDAYSPRDDGELSFQISLSYLTSRAYPHCAGGDIHPTSIPQALCSRVLDTRVHWDA